MMSSLLIYIVAVFRSPIIIDLIVFSFQYKEGRDRHEHLFVESPIIKKSMECSYRIVPSSDFVVEKSDLRT